MNTAFYEKLNVRPDATQDEIKKAYRKKAKELHPDVNPEGAEEFKELSIIYSVLADPRTRKEYDLNGTTDRVSNHVEQEAMSLAIQEISSQVAGGKSCLKIQIFDVAIENILSKAKADLKGIKAIKEQVALTDKVIAKIVHKQGKDSFIARALEAQRNQAAMMIRKGKEQIHIKKRARLILKEYKFNADAAEKNPLGFDPSPYIKITRAATSAW